MKSRPATASTPVGLRPSGCGPILPTNGARRVVVGPTRRVLTRSYGLEDQAMVSVGLNCHIITVLKLGILIYFMKMIKYSKALHTHMAGLPS